MRDGNAPTMARWLTREHAPADVEWETDLSSQTGASQAGILLGSNEDIPAFRWVEKETATLMTCSAPARLRGDRAAARDRQRTARRTAAPAAAISSPARRTHVILTVSRMEAEKKANPGYRAFFANGDNVTRALVLFVWEVLLEWMAALRAIRRDVRPRGHRGGIYPLLRGALCVVVRDLIVYGVLSDMMKGRPAVYATFSSYDEVAHHSGLERADTLEALRKLDEQFARIERARRYAPRPYEIVVLSDHGQTQGATFKQRNGYGLDELVERSLSRASRRVRRWGRAERDGRPRAVKEATGRHGRRRAKNDVSDRDVVVLGSGNLGLDLPDGGARRLTLEEIEARHPELLPALREHPHVGWLLVRSAEHGAVALGAAGAHYLADGRVEGEDPLAPFSPSAPQHLLRTDGFEHVADIMVGSFYDPELDEGCAFEELISFHGGIGGLQTRPFILHPRAAPSTRRADHRRGRRPRGADRLADDAERRAGRAGEHTGRRRLELALGVRRPPDLTGRAARALPRRRSRARARPSGRTGRHGRSPSPASPPRVWRRCRPSSPRREGERDGVLGRRGRRVDRDRRGDAHERRGSRVEGRGDGPALLRQEQSDERVVVQSQPAEMLPVVAHSPGTYPTSRGPPARHRSGMRFARRPPRPGFQSARFTRCGRDARPGRSSCRGARPRRRARSPGCATRLSLR